MAFAILAAQPSAASRSGASIDREAADVLVGLGERAVGQQRLAVLVAHDRGGARRVQARGEDPRARVAHLLVQRAQVGHDRLEHAGLRRLAVGLDHVEQVLGHVRSFVGEGFHPLHERAHAEIDNSRREPEAHAGADRRLLEPDRAAVGLDDRAGDRQAEPGARVVCARRRRGRTARRPARAGRRRCPVPVSATSISTPPSTSSARTVTLPSGGVWWIAFWIRLKSTRWSCSWLPCDGASGGAQLGAHGDRAGVGGRPHRLDRVVHELVQAHALHRPLAAPWPPGA